MENIKNIVFDLGGVIITLNHGEAVKRFKSLGVESADKLLDPYHQKGSFLAFEEGRISRETFYEEINKLAQKPITDNDIDWALYGFFDGVPAGKLEILEELRKQYKLYLLSNTNPIAVEWCQTPELWGREKTLKDYFDKVYLSYEIGASKPSKAIFEYLFADSGILPEETLFIDDGPANVQMGNELGMKTYMPENGADFRHIFENTLCY